MLHSRSAFRNDDLNRREVQYPVTRQALSRIQKPSQITTRERSGLARAAAPNLPWACLRRLTAHIPARELSTLGPVGRALCSDIHMAAAAHHRRESLLIRTHFADQTAWLRTVKAALAENRDKTGSAPASLPWRTTHWRAGRGSSSRAAALTAGQHAAVLVCRRRGSHEGSAFGDGLVDLERAGARFLQGRLRPSRQRRRVERARLQPSKMDWEELRYGSGRPGVPRGFDSSPSAGGENPVGKFRHLRTARETWGTVAT